MSGKFWTASGVTAGQDMAAAFVRHYVGLYEEKDKAKEVADHLLGVTEVMWVAQNCRPHDLRADLAARVRPMSIHGRNTTISHDSRMT